ncbi:hypothetical protein FA95DRAFT_1559164 [Auriscalpium vulgare]|uniref:Uncharacterized protein n=1 Tax=Auriscalpium vulgare TaxID=40419 RepID=A0ACB8RU85_9AGAM|nr:hypothetical protein FA95DRAFT_1559164 [Auriscalpium vulgare]
MTIADWGLVDKSGDRAAEEEADGTQHRYALMCKCFEGGMDDPRFVELRRRRPACC